MAVAVRERVERFPRPVERPALGARELAELCRYLEARLLRGEERIRDARAAGQEVAHLERRWRELLDAYERLSQLRSAYGR